MSNLDFSSLSPHELQERLNNSALQPPHGVVPNFDHPDNENSVALAGLVVSLILASIFLLIRVYVVFFKMKHSRLGDCEHLHMHLIAYVFLLVVCSGSLLRLSQAGLFVHQWDIRGRDISHYLQIVLIGVEFWFPGILLVKASILVEWLRLFAPAPGRTAFSTSCKLLLVANVLFYAAIIVTLNLSCRPFQKFWDKSLKGSCIDLRKIHLGAVIVDLLLDIAILILPQRIIWGLQMTKTKRFGVSTVFTIGVLATIASAFLFHAIFKWNQSDDMTYHYSAVVLWAVAEMTCGILVFCIPVVPKLAQVLSIPKCLSSFIASASAVVGGIKWPAQFDDERQSRSRISKTREYAEISESGSLRLRELGSPRPTDRQYGIAVTTDIVITESFDTPGQHTRVIGSQCLWDRTVP
ncbi:hypothetical protein F5Y01DRAFT_307120 [Xylaria sp. FL0043]|nr:hypothetical protein F5Y01DRAFT_307120 [Xylaria sp. FL0043]